MSNIKDQTKIRKPYQAPKLKCWGTVQDLTRHGVSHPGMDGKWYKNKGIYGSNDN